MQERSQDSSGGVSARVAGHSKHNQDGSELAFRRGKTLVNLACGCICEQPQPVQLWHPMPPTGAEHNRSLAFTAMTPASTQTRLILCSSAIKDSDSRLYSFDINRGAEIQKLCCKWVSCHGHSVTSEP